MPIHNVLILKNTGQTIFSWTQRSFNLDDDLLSSFTSAIFTFVSELGEKAIHVLDLENLKFLYAYESTYDLILAMGIERDDEKHLGTFKTILEEIKTCFIEKYETFLKKWNGEVSVFKGFEVEVDRIVKSVQECAEHIISLPFLLDENDVEITNFQKEIAVMFVAFEEEREKGGGRLRKRPSETFEYLTKVLWPLWIIDTKHGPIIADGFGLSSQKKTITTPIALKSFEDILNSNSIFALDKCEVLLDKIPQKEAIFDALIGPDFLKAMLKVLPTMQYCELSKIYSEPLRPILSKDGAIMHGTKLEEYFQLNHLATQNLEQLQSLLTTTTNDFERELDVKLKEIEEEFSNKLSITKEEVVKAIEKLTAQREKEIENKEHGAQSKIEELYRKLQSESQILNESTKSLLKFSGEILESTPSTSHEEFTQIFKENIRRIRLLLSSIEAAFHDTEDYLKKVDIRSDELPYALQKEVKEIIAKYNKLVSEQNERIVLLKKENEEKLASVAISKEMLESKRDKLLQKIESLKQRINGELEDLKKFIIPSEFIHTALAKQNVNVYIPCYLTKFITEENEIRFFVIPPCYLHTKFRVLSKKVPLSVDKLFFDDVKQLLEMKLNENQELRRIFDVLCNKHNFLKDKEIETMIYDGFKLLFEQKLISKNEYEKMSLAAIAAFRL